MSCHIIIFFFCRAIGGTLLFFLFLFYFLYVCFMIITMTVANSNNFVLNYV